ncbi:unnamed protein product [Gordionus sp. m RMFG-2023]
MVFFTIVIGGLTRLTESGLSMVSWHMFKEFPPITNEQWVTEFENYKLYPEFKIKNVDITLNEFKRIWYMEWIHRMSGRTIGLTFLIPALYFASKGWIMKYPSLRRRLIAYTLLLGFQGLLGWYMVKSGLSSKNHSPNPDGDHFNDDVPRVSQYRLAAHLGTAFVLYSLMLWATLGYLMPDSLKKVNMNLQPLKNIRRMAHATKSLIFITAISGAFVAGLDAGLIYNSFPKMGDYWIPSDIFTLSPRWKNFFENPAMVQMDHRILATITLSSVVATWFITKRVPKHMLTPRIKLACNCMVGMTTIQIMLGISTLLYHVPISLASLHQGGSLFLLSNAIWLTHELRKIPKL